MKYILYTLFICSTALGAGTGWRTVLADLLGKPPIDTVSVSMKSVEPDRAEVQVTNNGNETLKYSGYSAASPQLFWEQLVDGNWVDEGWMWCGTGMEEYSLAPNSTVFFVVSFRPGRRYFTIFDSLDGRKSSLILLYQPK